MTKFKIRPEVDTWKYWVHLVIIVLFALIVVSLVSKTNAVTIKNILVSVPLIASGDILAHLILRLD